ncbi:MAG: terpene synthase family protein [Stackebrandtia sp.]
MGPTGLGTSAARPPRPARGGAEPEELRIPRFHFPWPSACHPEVEGAERRAQEFAARFGLVPDAAYRTRLARTKYGWLAARCYPHADRELLQIAADYFTWFFIVDDLFVDRVQTVTPRTIPNLTAMIDVLDYNRPGADPVFGEHAWLDVCTRLRRRLSHEHFQRFAHGMRMWASTAGLQIVNHLQQSSVDVPQYETIRRHTSGTYPCLSLLDAAKAGPITPAEYNDPLAQRLCLHANNVVCWSNDVQSVQMEMNQPGQYWNMVVIYANQGLTLQESVDLVAQRVRSEIAAFQLLARATEQHAGDEMRGFIAGLRNWMRGYQDWVDHDTRRYAQAHIAEDADDTRVLA